MPTPVFDLNEFIDLPVQDSIQFSNVMVSLGDGYEIRGNKSQAFSGADGIGGVTSHKGLREFTVTLNFMDYANATVTKAVNKLEALYQATLGGQVPFYFYNPRETSSVDTGGTATTGRYLVRFKTVNPTEWFAPLRHRVTLTFVEVKA
jgi:hypothetical protein